MGRTWYFAYEIYWPLEMKEEFFQVDGWNIVWRKKQALHTKRKFKVLLSALENAINHNPISTKQVSQTTVFPHILSAETIFFFNLEIAANSNSCRNISIFLLNKLNFLLRKLFKGGNYSRAETILKKTVCTKVEFTVRCTRHDNCPLILLPSLIHWYFYQNT